LYKKDDILTSYLVTMHCFS